MKARPVILINALLIWATCASAKDVNLKINDWQTKVNALYSENNRCYGERIQLLQASRANDQRELIEFVRFRACIKKNSLYFADRLRLQIIEKKLNPPLLKPTNYMLNLTLLQRDIQDAVKAMNGNNIDYGLAILTQSKKNIRALNQRVPKRAGGKMVDQTKN